MALWLCGACGTAYAVGLSCCPQCQSSEYEEDGVAKITTGGGPSLHTDGGGDPEAAPDAPESTETAAPEPEPAPAAPVKPAPPAAVPEPPAPAEG